VRVNVDVAGQNRLARDVDDLGAGWNVDLPLRANGNDAVVLHDDIALLNDFGALHRENAGATKHDRSLWLVLRNDDRDVAPSSCVDRRCRRGTATTATSAVGGVVPCRRVARCFGLRE
jgi:hypothetical protein